jgi:hypothetical protein
MTRARLLVLVLACIAASRAGVARAQAEPTERGRLVVSPAVWEECTPDRFARGQQVLLTGGPFQANAPLECVFQQDRGDVPIGPVRATPRGGINATVTIPLEASPEEEARIRVTGPAENGGTLLLTSASLRIFPEDRDTDGDGVVDRCDNCPSLASSDLADDDYDGIGNACDSCPYDAANDQDGDGLCADVDPDPYTANGT